MATSKHRPRNLTATFIKQVLPEDKRIEVRDTSQKGLILRVTPGGVKAFYLQTRLRDRSRLNLKIGEFPVVSLAVARDMCREYLVVIARGEDPRRILRRREEEEACKSVTLGDLIEEYQIYASPKRAVWRKGARCNRKKPEAQASIENVFSDLLEASVTQISAKDIAIVAKTYKPKRPLKGKATANGAVSRALAYLKPVFDWAAGRNSFRKEGAGRDQPLTVADVSDVHDPSLDDPSILGKRDRILSQSELRAILPALKYPAVKGLRPKMPADRDYAPAAIKFLFLTMSRIEEIEEMRRGDVDDFSKTWIKSVKTNPGDPRVRGGGRVKVRVPLSTAAMSLLESLPTYQMGRSEDRIFPSSAGGRIYNWDRTSEVLRKFTNTEDWTRHDLRSTAATMLNQLGVSLSVIDRLLCHAQPFKSSMVSGSAHHYIFPVRILTQGPDPEREAFEILAKALDYIENENSSVIPVQMGVNVSEKIAKRLE